MMGLYENAKVASGISPPVYEERITRRDNRWAMFGK